VQWVPQDVGHRGPIRAPDVNTRKDAQYNVCHRKNSDGNVDGDGHILVDRIKKDNEAGEKQVYGKVQECRGYLDCKAHFVELRAVEQK
jgi:hypothetical protein